MTIKDKILFPFKNQAVDTPSDPRYLFNYRWIWKLAVLLLSGVALVPLIFITIVDYQVTQHAIESEFELRTTQVVSNTRRAISFFLSERKSALSYIVHDHTFKQLNDPERLSIILDNLKKSFGGGFVDIGVIDDAGRQRGYIGPYDLEGRDYSQQEWYKQVMEHGVYISDVFLGYRQVPHMIIAVKGDEKDGTFYILRTAIGIAPFENLLSDLEMGGKGDAFLINGKGILQTPSRNYGKVLDPILLAVPQYSPKTEILEGHSPNGRDLLVGYRFIDETPFILMIVKDKYELMKPWFKTRLNLIAFLAVSSTIILSVILAMATYMVRRMRLADEKRVMTLHEVEYANKMASIGRLAASVAHEINNPLAVINEKAGLIKDLFIYQKRYTEDPKLVGLVESILRCVKRAGIITKRLLNFARNLEATIEPINLKEVLGEVLSFLDKEAEHRSVTIMQDISDDIPLFESDRGKIQQIFLNIINNAFAAVNDGGHLDIRARLEGKTIFSITFEDDGCGIPKDDLHHVFEPFFSTKTKQGGTGLGLSITYNLVHELGGQITVSSEVGKGTRFTILLPLKMKSKEETDACSISG
ncbi:MAG: sensor histidine kinase [Deltaproteobacteria bacterium]|nr:sensor histidine kinase [Deltaproteobacteria bacterium]